MLGQTTDSGSSNNTMAREMEKMFGDCEKPVEWDSSVNHVRCYAHKLGLVVKKGLKVLGLAAGHVKPTTPPNVSVPVPTIILNDELTQDAIDYEESDDEDSLPTAQSQGVFDVDEEELDDYPTYDDTPVDGCVVVQGAMKVRLFLFHPILQLDLTDVDQNLILTHSWSNSTPYSPEAMPGEVSSKPGRYRWVIVVPHLLQVGGCVGTLT